MRFARFFNKNILRFVQHPLSLSHTDNSLPRIMNKYLVYTKDLRKDGDVLCLPVYMTMFL